MENQKKANSSAVIWIGLLIVVVVVILWLYSKKPASLMYSTTETAPAASGALTTVEPVTVTDRTVLKRGIKNSAVLRLQQIINKANVAYGLPTISEDGNFGSGTEAALKKLTGKTEISLHDAEQLAYAKTNYNNLPDISGMWI